MEYEIETAHGRLFCRREGSGPILLLIHGVACDSEFFRETSKLLAETFTVISYDRRGYSRSIAAEGENDFCCLGACGRCGRDRLVGAETEG